MIFSSKVSWFRDKMASSAKSSHERRKFKRALQVEELESRRLLVGDLASIINISPDVSPNVGNSYAGRNQGMALVGNRLYFVANDAVKGNEVRWLDTTIANPTESDVHVIDLNPNSGNSVPLQSTSPEKFSNRFFLVD
jgi:ELWxxDGT repeat protein